MQKLPYAYLTAEKEPCPEDIQCIKIPVFANMVRVYIVLLINIFLSINIS